MNRFIAMKRTSKKAARSCIEWLMVLKTDDWSLNARAEVLSDFK